MADWRGVFKTSLGLMSKAPTSDIGPEIKKAIAQAQKDEPGWTDREAWLWADNFRRWHHLGEISPFVFQVFNLRAFYDEPPREGPTPSSTHWAYCGPQSPHSQTISSAQPLDEDEARALGPKGEGWHFWPYDADTGEAL